MARVNLNKEQMRVLRLAAAGKTIPQIAADLQRSVGSVQNIRQKIFQKLRASSMQQAITNARKEGIL